jgi:hypothetical protein
LVDRAEFDTGDVGLEEPDWLLSLLVDIGSRDTFLAASCIWAT